LRAKAARKVKAKALAFSSPSSSNAASSNTGSRRRRHYRPMSEINVTPMVDVMLVLLIVFMVAAPLLTVGVPVNLPKTGAQALRGDEEPLAISINADGQIFIQETQIERSMLVPRLSNAFMCAAIKPFAMALWLILLRKSAQRVFRVWHWSRKNRGRINNVCLAQFFGLGFAACRIGFHHWLLDADDEQATPDRPKFAD
jgi:biopolymer transport protein ExbD